MTIKNHFPRKKHYLCPNDFKKMDDDSPLNENPDDVYFQIHHTTGMTRIYGPRLPLMEQNNSKTVNSVNSDLVFRFKVLIEENFKRHLLPSAYADMLAVHPNYLNRITKKQTNKTSSELINERIKPEAISLLIYSNASISGISYQPGFEDTSHFSKFFKKLTGISPGKYRKC